MRFAGWGEGTDMRKWILVSWFLGWGVLCGAEEALQRQGKVWSLEEQSVYFTLPDGTAVKAPRNATFLKLGQPVSPEQLKTGDSITVLYPEGDFEILAGPYPPNALNPLPHRTIRRGPESVHQNFKDGRWEDRP